MVVPICNPATQEAEAGRQKIQSQPGQLKEILLKIKQNRPGDVAQW
jgi:hypothetical protein